jgi:hypothetical protein
VGQDSIAVAPLRAQGISEIAAEVRVIEEPDSIQESQLGDASFGALWEPGHGRETINPMTRKKPLGRSGFFSREAVSSLSKKLW